MFKWIDLGSQVCGNVFKKRKHFVSVRSFYLYSRLFLYSSFFCHSRCTLEGHRHRNLNVCNKVKIDYNINHHKDLEKHSNLKIYYSKGVIYYLFLYLIYIHLRIIYKGTATNIEYYIFEQYGKYNLDLKSKP